MDKKTIIILLSLVAVGAVTFFGGLTLGKNQVSANIQSPEAFRSGQSFNPGDFAGRMNGSRTGSSENLRGTILSADGSSVVLQLADQGGSKIVMLSDSTQIMETKSVDASVLESGKSVTIMGTSNEDGTISAASIMLRDAPLEAL